MAISDFGAAVHTVVVFQSESGTAGCVSCSRHVLCHCTFCCSVVSCVCVLNRFACFYFFFFFFFFDLSTKSERERDLLLSAQYCVAVHGTRGVQLAHANSLRDFSQGEDFRSNSSSSRYREKSIWLCLEGDVRERGGQWPVPVAHLQRRRGSKTEE